MKNLSEDSVSVTVRSFKVPTERPLTIERLTDSSCNRSNEECCYGSSPLNSRSTNAGNQVPSGTWIIHPLT